MTRKLHGRRYPDGDQLTIFQSGIVRWCSGQPRMVYSVPIVHNGTRYIVNQCPECREEIRWCRWRMDGKWTGPEKIQVVDIGGPPCTTPAGPGVSDRA